jgi:hypothetical protein
MGKQIRFFMLGEDEVEFFEQIRSINDILLNNKLESMNIDELIKEAKIILSERKLPIIRQLFISSPDSKIIKKDSERLDSSVSDVVEFSLTKIIKVDSVCQIQPGRIWAEFRYFNQDEQIVRKEKWFEKRFEQYRRWIKKNSKIDKYKAYYIFPYAYELYLEGKHRFMLTPNLQADF